MISIWRRAWLNRAVPAGFELHWQQRPLWIRPSLISDGLQPIEHELPSVVNAALGNVVLHQVNPWRSLRSVVVIEGIRLHYAADVISPASDDQFRHVDSGSIKLDFVDVVRIGLPGVRKDGSQHASRRIRQEMTEVSARSGEMQDN